MAYKIVNDDSLTSVANAIRVQGSISGTLEFPDGFVSAIQNLSPSPTIEPLSVTANGTYSAPSGVDGYSPVTVNVSGGGSGLTLLGSAESPVNTTSTSAKNVTSLQCGETAWTDNDIIWVHIRDKAGPRKGYHYGTDSFFINARKANGQSVNSEDYGIESLRVESGGTFYPYNRKVGVYAAYITSSGRVQIQSIYSSANTLTINGVYQIEVYKISLPSGVKLFEAVPE